MKTTAYNYFIEFVAENNIHVNDAKSILTKQIKTFSKEIKKPTIESYGFKTQYMFYYLATSLNKTKLICTEDLGLIFCNENSEIARPDFKIILEDNSKLFVEVKNQYKYNKHKFTKKYIEKLNSYSTLQQIPIYIALYWGKTNIWTLITLDYIKTNNYKIDLLEAMKYSHMNILGDKMIGIKTPIKIRIDKETNTVAFFSQGAIIREGHNIQLLIDLIQYSHKFNVINESETLSHTEITFDTPTDDENQEENGFKVINFLSSILSNKFNSEIFRSDKLKTISAEKPYRDLATTFENYNFNESLSLYLFTIKSN